MATASGPRQGHRNLAAANAAAALAAAAGRPGGGIGRSGEHDPQIDANRQTLQEMIREVLTQVRLPFHAKFTIIEGLIGGRY